MTEDKSRMSKTIFDEAVRLVDALHAAPDKAAMRDAILKTLEEVYIAGHKHGADTAINAIGPALERALNKHAP